MFEILIVILEIDDQACDGGGDNLVLEQLSDLVAHICHFLHLLFDRRYLTHVALDQTFTEQDKFGMRLEFLRRPCLQAFDFTVDREPLDEEIQRVLANTEALVIVVFLTIAIFTIHSLRIVLGARFFLVLIFHAYHR